jgi:RND superfamily putative drug exporter
MRFMGAANWGQPPFLAGLHARRDLREHTAMGPAGATARPPRLPDEQPFPYALHWEEAGPEQTRVDASDASRAPAPPPPPPPEPPRARERPRPAVPPPAREGFRPAPAAPEPPQLVFRTPDDNGSAPANGAPWRPWADGPPQPRPRHNPRVRREITPNPDGSGWSWTEVPDHDTP